MMSIDEIKSEAAHVSAAMMNGTMTPDLRTQFIKVRGALFLRGIYDPVLVRFDSATATRATNTEVAEQLKKIAESLA
jgi:hypothetical protein